MSHEEGLDAVQKRQNVLAVLCCAVLCCAVLCCTGCAGKRTSTPGHRTRSPMTILTWLSRLLYIAHSTTTTTTTTTTNNNNNKQQQAYYRLKY